MVFIFLWVGFWGGGWLGFGWDGFVSVFYYHNYINKMI